MAITYHAGRRIQATSTDFGTAGAGIPGVSGGWKELGRTTLGSSGDSIDVSSLADKRYLMFLLDSRSNGTAISTTWKANGSTGNEYSFRRNHDGTETDANTQPSAATSWTSIVTNAFGVGYAANKSGKEKLFLEHEVYQNTAGTGTSTTRTENAFKWTGTDVIDQLTMHNSSSGDIVSGSELVVLGWDPADTHTTNFWEELGTTTASGSSSTLDVTFTGRKYLWIQAYTEPASSDTTSYKMGTGGSIPAGDNYTYRWSLNGGTDTAVTILSHVQTGLAAQTRPTFTNIFIVNTASNEKLGYFHTVCENTAGAGTAPARSEGAFKFINTSAVMDIFRLYNNSSSNFNSNSFVKVWGSD
jgi:hypothetical protein